MKYYRTAFPFMILVIIAVCCGCGGVLRASLGTEVLLKPGSAVSIAGEELEIKFIEVAEDSRCPEGATCVWEGRARSAVIITTNGIAEDVELTQPGLYTGMTEQEYNSYTISFYLEPYPEVDEEIADNEYRLRLTVTLSE